MNDALHRVCRDIALYTNLFCPYKKLISKERDPAAKGVRYIKRYNTPRTPLERLASFPSADQERLSHYTALREATNSILLLRSVNSQLRALAGAGRDATPENRGVSRTMRKNNNRMRS